MPRDIIIGFLMAAPGLFFFALSLNITSSHDMAWAGSKTFPLLTSGLMGVLGIATVIFANGNENREISFAEIKNLFVAGTETLSRLAVILAIMVVFAYGLVLEWIGFLIATFLLMAFLSFVAGLRRPFSIILLSTMTTGVIWLVFTKAFSYSLPMGSFLLSFSW